MGRADPVEVFSIVTPIVQGISENIVLQRQLPAHAAQNASLPSRAFAKRRGYTTFTSARTIRITPITTRR